MKPTPKLQAWLEEVESGRVESQSAKIIRCMMQNKLLTTWEISQILEVKLSTVTARLDSLLRTGIIYKCGQRQPQGSDRDYSLYMYIQDPENRAAYGKMYALQMAKANLKNIIKDRNNVYGANFKFRVDLEIGGYDTAIKDLKINLGIQETNAA